MKGFLVPLQVELPAAQEYETDVVGVPRTAQLAAYSPSFSSFAPPSYPGVAMKAIVQNVFPLHGDNVCQCIKES
jgi:hypothetical protein